MPAPLQRPGTTPALLLAVLAVAAALVAAVGPATAERAEYSWPPATLPDTPAGRGYYAPLPLLNRVPSAIAVELPCGLATPLSEAQSVDVLATARQPRAAGALWLSHVNDELAIGVGRRALARLPWPGSCPLDLEIAESNLLVSGRTIPLDTDSLADMPVVTGLFTPLDLRTGAPPRITVRTRTYATSQTFWQTVAALLSVALAGAALVLLARGERRLPRLAGLRHGLRSAWGSRHASDAAVVGLLLVWWIVAPTFTDDGWVWLEHRALGDLGANTILLDTWGVNSPTGFWLEWLRHRGSGTPDLVFARLPALMALLASWPLCRWCLHQAVEGGPPSMARWALAGAFVVNAFAWGMTLRPEPFLAILVLASLCAMLSFARRPGLVPLSIAGLAAVLAITAHPLGIVAVTPLLACLPDLIRWIRHGEASRWSGLGALVLACGAVGLVLFTLDSDLGIRLADAAVARSGELHKEPPWREYIRYMRFDQYGADTAPRHLSLALLFLSVAAWLTRRRRTVTGVSLLPARSIALGLLLLAFIPSKWPWHFGAFIAIGAVATGVEVARVQGERARSLWSLAKAVAALALVAAAAAWSWSAHGQWTYLDLQELQWDDVFSSVAGVVLAAVVLVAPFLVLRRRRSTGVVDDGGVVHATAGWTVAAVSFAVVAVTATMLVVDAARAPWSTARQNLEAFAGGQSCGLGHQLTGDRDVVDLLARADPPTLLVPSVGMYFPCVRPPSIDGGVLEMPGLVVYQWDPWPLDEADGPFAAVRDLYSLHNVATGPPGVTALLVVEDMRGFVRVDTTRTG